MSDFRVLQDQLARAVRDPEYQVGFDVEARRLAVYRRLVFNNFYGLLSNGFKLLVRALGREAFRKLVSGFIQSQCSSTPYFAQISAEFCDWLQTQSVDEWCKQLARYERAGIYIDIETSEMPSFNAHFDVHSKLIFSPALALMNFDYEVFDVQEGEPPKRKATWILLYRNPHNKLRYKELNALSFALVVMMVEGLSLESACNMIADQSGMSAAQLMTHASAMAMGLQQEGALLGSDRP